MSVKSKIRQAAFNRHIWIEKLNLNVELEKFLSQFRNHYVSCDLIRIGGDGDGGIFYQMFWMTFHTASALALTTQQILKKTYLKSSK
tara:strand:+ start:273 stop:533 length:261 start_codon:yes stop_codon:yes gene_type:complete